MSNNKDVLAVAGMHGRAARFSRLFDALVVTAVILLFMGIIHLHMALTVGDWDMFIDWKDRQYWPLVMPISLIMLPAALQAAFWIHFRLPIGATVGAVVLIIGAWIARYFGWHIWAYFPFPMIIPSHILAGAVMMDCVLVITQSAFFTAIGGGFLFSLLFYPSNYASLAPYYLPVEHMNSVASVADMVGYAFPRSGTPEYIRIIERGTLRTFGDGVIWVSAAFAGFICILLHFIWWRIGAMMASAKFLPNTTFVSGLMGVKPNETTERPAGVVGAGE
jgi:methane/ammonia monooxygenase subunit A